MTHRWHFFRAGGVDQVSLRDGTDLLALAELDQKLWVALAMPVKDVDLDPETLALIDLDRDGRIRVLDVLAAVTFVRETFKSPGDVLHTADEVQLSALASDVVVAAAKRMLADLGKPEATAISVADTVAIEKAFADTVLNGDGIVIPASTKDDELRKVIEDAIAAVGSVVDRSGKPGIDRALADKLFEAVDARVTWQRAGGGPALTLGDRTPAAADALAAVRDKLDDFFTRCRVAAYDPRGAAAMSGANDELVAIAAHQLSAGNDELAKLPLARIDPGGKLPLTSGLNPAWSERMAAFSRDAVAPINGPRDALVAGDLAQIDERLAAYRAWRSAEPKTVVDKLEPAWLERLATPAVREALFALIEDDKRLAAEYDQINGVAKAARLQRDFGRLLRNFVNFSDFYSRQDGVFQAGTLYLDARALHLCVAVADVAKHAALATSADSALIYCDITRKGETKHIAAALTNGDPDNIFVGRNGVFYDREGRDWDATITKVVSNPISIREAFWTPYKKLIKTIEDNVTKRAAAADAEAAAKMDAVGKTVAHTDQAAAVVPGAAGAAPAATPAAAPAAAPSVAPGLPGKKIDLGTVAAIGVAIGGIGTLVGALLATLFGLGAWLPLGILAILLLISGPAMMLAWLKLRRRNLGPILDANGWAINNRARVNVAFGAAMTELAKLPKGSARSLDDPFADKRTPWRRWVVLALVVVIAGAWYVGRLDSLLPGPVQSIRVLGKHAPAAKRAALATETSKAAAAAEKPAPAPAPAAPAGK